MKRRRLHDILLVSVCLVFGNTAARAARPALVVVIVIDQLRGDYLQQYSDHFVDGGFRRLIRNGAWYQQAYFEYGPLATGPGHASLLTGANPARHGIVANTWLNPADGSRQYCCGDAAMRAVGLPPEHQHAGRSPALLMIPTLGDQLKQASGGRAKVWTVSLKDRSAMLTAGRQADGALWWDSRTGRFVSSSYFFNELPSWARQLNDARVADEFFQKSWDRLLPASTYDLRFLAARPGSDAYQRFHANEFPKLLGRGMDRPGPAFYSALYASPFGNELILAAARRIIEAEQLGTDEQPDLLVIGLSSNDAVGHVFGPDSHEVMDTTVRTDRQLAAFFDWLDRQVQWKRCLVALSSDHGVVPIPEYAAALGLPSGRLKPNKIIRFIEQRLRERIGAPQSGPGLLHGLKFPWLYVDVEAVNDAGLDLETTLAAAATAAVEHPGVARAFTCNQVTAPGFAAQGRLERAVFNSYHPGRSGQIYLHWEKYWYPAGATTGHGSAHDYDRHVPVLICGPGVAFGVSQRRVSPTGLVPTLCALLDIPGPPGADGEVFSELVPRRR